MNSLAHVFQAMLKEEKKRTADFAKAVNVAPANITRVMQGQTPSDELLRKMCDAKNWNDPFRGLLVLEARLRDVIEASGHTLEEIYPCIASEESKGISQDLIDINNYMRRNPDLYRMISMMADSVRQTKATAAPAQPITCGGSAPWKRQSASRLTSASS